MKKYYHGSFNDLHVGQILIPTKDYINNWENTDFYYWLEKYRPKEFLAHHESVFMCDNIDDLDNACGGNVRPKTSKKIISKKSRAVSCETRIHVL